MEPLHDGGSARPPAPDPALGRPPGTPDTVPTGAQLTPLPRRRPPRRVEHQDGALVASVVTAERLGRFMHRTGIAGDRAVAWIAGQQLGVVTTPQLTLAGLSRRAIARRRERGLLRPIHRGVYAWGSSLLIPGAAELAGWFACGPEAYVSHRSAAVLWGLVEPQPTAPVVLTVVGDHRRGARPLRFTARASSTVRIGLASAAFLLRARRGL